MTAGQTDKMRLRLWLKILKVSKTIETELRERLRADFDSTLPRFDVMAALYRTDQGLKMSELSGVLKVSNGNTTGIIDRLVKDGLVMRVPVEGDRRAMMVRLTGQGREHFKTLASVHEQWVSELLSSVSPADAEQLMEMLETIGTNIKQPQEIDA